jgi:hypothetical protein
MPDATLHVPSSQSLAPSGRWAQVLEWSRRHEGFLAVLIFAGCFLSPLLRSPFIGDDMLTSSVAGVLHLRDCSLADLARERLQTDLAQGRLTLIASLAGPYVSYFTSDVVVHKRMVLALVLANLLLFYALLCRWGVNAAVAQLGMLCLVCLFQMRLNDDPLLSFQGLMQLLTIQLLLSLLALDAYVRTARWQWLAISAALYALSILTDTASYSFGLVLFAPIYAHFGRWRPALRAFLPYLAISLVALVVIICLRIHFRDILDADNKLHWSLPKIVKTTVAQASSALPISYLTLCGAERARFWRPELLVTRWENWFALFGVAGLSLFLLRRIAEDKANNLPQRSELWRAGLALWLSPALFLAVCASRQAMWLGAGYRPVYLECFGAALLIVAGLGRLASVLSVHWRKCGWSLALITAIVAVLTFDSNQAVVANWREVNDRDMRVTMEAAFAAGLGDEIPQDSTVLLTTWRSWLAADRPEIANAFFSKCVGRRINVIDGTPRQWPPPSMQPGSTLPRLDFALCEQCPNDHSGYVILCYLDGDVDFERLSPTGLHYPVCARKFRVFVRDEVLAPNFFAVPNQVYGHFPGTLYGARDNRFELIKVTDLRLVRRGRDWAVYEGGFSEPADVAALGMVGYPVFAEIHSARVAGNP